MSHTHQNTSSGCYVINTFIRILDYNFTTICAMNDTFYTHHINAFHTIHTGALAFNVLFESRRTTYNVIFFAFLPRLFTCRNAAISA